MGDKMGEIGGGIGERIGGTVEGRYVAGGREVVTLEGRRVGRVGLGAHRRERRRPPHEGALRLMG